MCVPWAFGMASTVNISLSEMLFSTVCKMLSSVGPVDDSNFIAFLTTFDIEIWYYLGMAFFAVIIISTLSDILIKHQQFTWKNFKIEGIDYFWMYLSALFYEGSFRTPASRRSQVLLGLWLIAMLTLLNAFCGQFKAVLMKQKEEPELLSNDDLAGRDDMNIQLGFGTFCAQAYMDSPRPSYSKIRQKILSSDSPSSIVDSNNFQGLPTYQKVKDGGWTAFFEKTAIMNWLMDNCHRLVGRNRLYFVREDDAYCHITIGMRDDLPKAWMKKLNSRITWMKEGHIIGKLVADSTWKYAKCEQTYRDAFEGIKLDNLKAVFYLLFMIDAFAFLCLIGEVIRAKWCIPEEFVRTQVDTLPKQRRKPRVTLSTY